MASSDIHGTMDIGDMLKNHVNVILKIKGANRAIRRLLAMKWVLRFLAWVGGVKAVIVVETEINTEMEADIAAWERQGKPLPPPRPKAPPTNRVKY